MQADPAAESFNAIVRAKTRGGLDLPVIDVTHPRFRVPDDPGSLKAQRDAFIAWDHHRRHVPKWITQFMLGLAVKRSRLMRAMFQSDKGFLDSISTYILKLGEKDLPPGVDGPFDRMIARSPHVVLVRLRMQQIAGLLAGALVEPLASDTAAPLHFINIAGGPALDSINAIIVLNRGRPELLRRPIVIDVLDTQDDGPRFGANALAALQAPGGPLRGLGIEFLHRSYDWNDPAKLRALVADLISRGAIMAASSEGGLFEYGTDQAIVANLKALRAGVRIVAGSVTSSSELRKRMIAETRFRLYPRGIEGFAPLAAQAGYAVAESKSAVLSEQVLLRPLG